MTKEEYLEDQVFQRLQWEVRAAFERGFRAAGGKDWKPHWFESDSRKFLIESGLMTGEEGYK